MNWVSGASKFLKRGQGVVKANAIEGGMAVVGFGVDYAVRRNEGESRGSAALKAGATNAAWLLAPNVMWAYTGIQIAESVGEYAGKKRMEKRESYYDSVTRQGFGGNFQDSQFAATSRQRGMQAIQQSKLNARSALTNQARSLHRM